ncbi:MAG: hypothetical protein QOH91_4246 [Mycobacterium sp.]|jgi:hypothetical protein|nr:hypothetical protein [Mycobacterium sp.]
MPVRSIATLHLLNLRRTIWAIAGAQPGPERNITGVLIAQRPRHITELGLGLPRDPFLK